MNVPALIYAGDTVKWNEPATPDYSSTTGWAATFYLRHGTGGEHFTSLAGVADGSGGWNFTITAAQSAELDENGHWWQITVTKAEERYTLGTGTLSVKANIPTTNTYDGRTQAEKDLDAVRAAMRAIVTGGATQEYSIGNRSLKKMPMADLIALETKLKADVSREARADRLAKGMNSGRAVYVRF